MSFICAVCAAILTWYLHLTYAKENAKLFNLIGYGVHIRDILIVLVFALTWKILDPD